MTTLGERTTGATRVYIACPLTWAGLAEALAFALAKEGHDVVSTWHEGGLVRPEPTDPDACARLSEQCRRQVTAADVIVCLTTMGIPRGTLIEVGFALGLGKPVVWLGSERVPSIFVQAPGVVRIASRAELLAAVAEVGKSDADERKGGVT